MRQSVERKEGNGERRKAQGEGEEGQITARRKFNLLPVSTLSQE